MDNFTRADVCVTAAADTWTNSGELLAHAAGTIPTIGARLAKLTSAPELVLTDGGPLLMSEPPSLGMSGNDGGVIEGWAPFRRVFDIVASGRRQSMMGASQIDRYGNQNISLIGDWQRPKKQLIGVRGAPGNTANHRVDYWIPKHSPRVFVEAVDLVSGVGNDRAAKLKETLRFHNLGVVITNLAVFDFADDGKMRLRSIHPGVTQEEVAENTGFEIDTDVAVTRTPNENELRIINETIDPQGSRFREIPK